MFTFLPNQYLFAARQAIIFWTQMSVWPLEYTYDTIIDELKQRGMRID